MEIDPSKQEAVCPYCGAKELICDSDAVAVEKIKSSTFKGNGICAYGKPAPATGSY